VLVSACATNTPPERFHTLLPAEHEAAAAVTPLIAIDMARVSVPAQVDHPQWAVRQPDGSLRLLEQERWAAPLADELRAALVDRLAVRWGVMDVRGLGPARAAWRVRVEVERFESMPQREARLEAAWSVSPATGDGPAMVCHTALTEAVHEGGAPALAQAHQRAAQRLADEIGERVRQEMQLGDGQARCVQEIATP
jgi:uncharacterized lipoprotein YmbA